MKKKPHLTPIEQFKKVCRRYLSLDEGSEYIDVVFGVVFANRLDSAPLWLYLIGPASSGKTVILQGMRGHKEIICRSTMTYAGLVGGKGKDKKITKTPLLDLLNNKMLIIKDFTTMLSMRYEDLNAILGQLRDCYDGDMDRELAQETVSHTSKFGVIAAVTNAIDRHLTVLADLGERFLSYRMPPVSEGEERKRCLKTTSIESEDEQKEAIRRAAHRLLDCDPVPAEISLRQRRDLIDAAIVVAKARCHITRDKFSKDPEEAEREIASRVSKQLVDLTRGIAMVRGKSRVTESEMSLAKRAAAYTLTLRRIKLLRMMADREWLDIGFIMNKMHLSDKGARIQLDDLVLVGLCEKSEGLSDAEGVKCRWRLRERGRIRRLMKGVSLR